MLVAHTPQQQKNIVNNLVAACRDIKKLNKTGYGFIYLASGFIAHYNLNGFIDYYTHESNLRNAILSNQRNNQWANFSPSDKNYAYYMSKRDIYNAVCEKINP
jgi:hypothetical protein